MYLKDDDFTTINGMLSTKPVARLPDEAMRSRMLARKRSDAWVCGDPASSQTTRRAMYAITIVSGLKTVSKMLLQQVTWGMPG